MPSQTLRPESERYYYWIKYRVTFISVMIFFGVSLLVLLVWGVSSNLINDGDGNDEDTLADLQKSNKQLQTRLEKLEKKLNLAGEMISEVHSHCLFYGKHHHTPKVEKDLVELRVEDWETALLNGLQEDVAGLSFKAGEKLGPLFQSTWTLYLSSGGGGLNVHLALDKWDAGNNGGSLWAAFSTYILRPDGTIAISKSHPVTNVMDNLVVGKDSDETWPELVIHNLMRLDSVAPLLANGSLTLRAELELFGHGTRVYREKSKIQSQSDTQTVVFAVDGSKGSNSSKTVAFSTFVLHHPWGTDSKWAATVERRNLTSNDSSMTFSLALTQVWDDDIEWDEFWATFSLEVKQGTGEETTFTTAPLHDFMSISRLTLANILNPKIQHNNTNTASKATSDKDVLEFKVSLTLLNRNARFYIDLR